VKDESIGEAAASRRVKTGAAPAPQRKLWHAGTPTYTSGGLVVLFSWLLWGDFAWSMRERAVFGIVLDLTGHPYRYTFLMSSGIAVAAMMLMITVHRRFVRLGGPEHYVAPE